MPLPCYVEAMVKRMEMRVGPLLGRAMRWDIPPMQLMLRTALELTKVAGCLGAGTHCKERPGQLLSLRTIQQADSDSE